VFRVERTTFIYWPINVLQELDLSRWAKLKEWPSSIGQSRYSRNLICQGVPTWKNYLHLLAKWMHSKSFIYKTSPTWKHCEKGTFMYGWIECIQRVLFVKVFQLEISIFIYWSIGYISKASFVKVF
jgi:hypothetical protein